jgi:hypothetical protein
VDITLGGGYFCTFCVICRVQIVKKGSKIDVGQQQIREKDSNSDKCRNRVKWRHGMGHWIAPTSKKRETHQNRGGKGSTDQNREINDKTVRNC